MGDDKDDDLMSVEHVRIMKKALVFQTFIWLGYFR